MNKKKTTLKDQVYENLLYAIINGIFPPDMIISEKLLMDKYQVSRAPIREALQQLSERKFLKSIPRQGYKICHPDARLVMEIERFRSSLEPNFLERNFSAIGEKCIQELRVLCEQYDACDADDYLTRWKCNCQFHLRLFSAYNNDYAYDLLEHSLMIQTIYFVQTKHYATMSLHLAVVDYIEHKDISMAVQLLRADIEGLVETPLKKA